jgi:hypothetical protein
MGTWDPGNFDSDGALDYIDSLRDDMCKAVDTTFAVKGAADLDDDGESLLMPSVEILVMLSSISYVGDPSEEKILEWKRKYLAIFDAQIDGLKPKPDHKVQRRKVIEDTFDRLAAIARKWQAVYAPKVL